MTGRDGEDVGREFELLSDETRLGILRALAERLREAPDEPALGFADLRRRVGMRDSGNFNYHLGKLEDRFVIKTEEGYRLAPAGLRVVAALISGAYGRGESLGPTAIGDPCPVCGEELSATYRAGMLTVVCPDDHEFRNTLPPGAVDDRSLSEVVDLFAATTRRDLTLAVEGTCPFCYGRLPWDLGAVDGPMQEFATQCERCGARLEVPAGFPVLLEPAAVAACHEHDLDPRDLPPWAPELYDAVEVSDAGAATDGDDAGAVTVTVALDDARVVATFDRTLSTTAVRVE